MLSRFVSFLNQQKVFLWTFFFFLLAIFVIFSPVLEGFIPRQEDELANHGLVSELFAYRSEHQKEIYWTDKLFSGSPTTQLYVQLDTATPLDHLIDWFWPRNAYTIIFAVFWGLCIAFCFFYIPLQLPYFLALGYAFAYVFSAYKIHLIDAGHVSKLNTLVLLPLLLWSFLYALQKENKTLKILFFVVIAGFLQIRANHVQMTYYFFFLLGFLSIYKGFLAYQNKQMIAFFRGIGIFGLGIFIAILMHFNLYLQSYRFSQQTMRGGKEIQLSKNQEGEIIPLEKKASGLDLDYMTSWSYGPAEFWSYLIPKIKGKGSGSFFESKDFQKNMPISVKKKYQQAQDNGAAHLLGQLSNTYWGDQPFTTGLMYLGIWPILGFLLFFAFFDQRKKWILAGGILLCMLLAAGRSTLALTAFFAQYFPFYNKFRAVSSFLAPLDIFIFLLSAWFWTLYLKEKKLKNYRKIFYFSGFLGILFLIFYIFPTYFFDFFTLQERNIFQQLGFFEVQDYLEKTRIELVRESILRTLLILGIGNLLFFYHSQQKITDKFFFLGFSFLILIDILSHSLQYQNTIQNPDKSYKHWLPKNHFSMPYLPSKADLWIYENEKTPMIDSLLDQKMKQLHQDDPEKKRLLKKSQREIFYHQFRILNENSHFRVLNLQNPFSDPQTPYFHKAVGGYNPVKLSLFQDWIDFYLSDAVQDFSTVKDSLSADAWLLKNPLLHLLNTKYIIFHPEYPPLVNPYRLSPAFMVKEVLEAQKPEEELLFLQNLDVSKAIVPTAQAKDLSSKQFSALGKIDLVHYDPNQMEYFFESSTDQFVVFSEIFYPDWKAEIDQKEVPIFKTNYGLRGLFVPAGVHIIRFSILLPYLWLGNIFRWIGFIFLMVLVILFLNKRRIRSF